MTPEEPHLPLLERVAPRIKDNLDITYFFLFQNRHFTSIERCIK